MITSSLRFKAREAASAQEADEQDLREIREAEFAFYFLFLIVSRPSYVHISRRERDRRRKAALFANVLDRLVDVHVESYALDYFLSHSPGEFVIKRIKHE